MLKPKYLLIFVAIVLLMVFTGCSNKQKVDTGEKAKADVVKVAYIAMVQASPQALINTENNIFGTELAKLGRKVEFVRTRSLDNIWPMMDSEQDDPDFVYIPTANFSTYITETSRFGGSNKYTIIAGSNNSDSTVLIVGPSINSLKDLDGKTVGIANQRYQDEFQFNKMLNTVGLSTSSVGGTVKIAWDDIVTKEIDNFANKKYDAILLYSPDNFPVALSKVPGSKILSTLNPNGLFGDKQPRNWLVAKKEVMKDEPELVKALLKAHVLATQQAMDQVDKISAINREVYLSYFEEQNADTREILKRHTPEFHREQWKKVGITYDPNLKFVTGCFEFMEQCGLTKGKDLKDFVDLSLLNEVLEEMGKETIK